MTTRRSRVILLLVWVLTAVAACSGGGTHTQSYSPSPTDSSTTSSSAPSTSSSPTDPKSSTSSKPNTKPVATPTVAPAGQGAVNAYVGMANVLNRWDLNPASSMSAALQKYVTSSALEDFIRIYQQMAASHVAYRGNPDVPHLKVVSATTSSAVLSDCSTPAPVNPSIQYDVKTGKPVKTTAGGPYLKAITVLKSGGAWRVNSIVPNTAKVCKP